VVLVRLAPGAARTVDLVASWTRRDGATRTERTTVEVPATPETFDGAGVRKATALARYARELRDWARAAHDGADPPVPVDVSPARAERFAALRAYLDREAGVLEDDGLRREASLLARLSWPAPAGDA
jgi:Ca-activated chloride channel family protein